MPSPTVTPASIIWGSGRFWRHLSELQRHTGAEMIAPREVPFILARIQLLGQVVRPQERPVSVVCGNDMNYLARLNKNPLRGAIEAANRFSLS
jgi:hypothetical protein